MKKAFLVFALFALFVFSSCHYKSDREKLEDGYFDLMENPAFDDEFGKILSLYNDDYINLLSEIELMHDDLAKIENDIICLSLFFDEEYGTTFEDGLESIVHLRSVTDKYYR